MPNNKYKICKAPKDFPGKVFNLSGVAYCYEHILIWWLYTGQLPEKGKTNIHHKNNNTKDNRIENLELITIKQHSKRHKKGRKMCKVTCTYCKKTFLKEKRQIKVNQTNFYCNTLCMSKGFKN